MGVRIKMRCTKCGTDRDPLPKEDFELADSFFRLMALEGTLHCKTCNEFTPHTKVVERYADVR